ncbi:MAG TPA: lysophospholipid acyltransferase family protein [Candidatus Limnocylindrales bacterium]|nr:lysophospholipid acyltransferase family protein [Candidatus Limnocylindrales bacterium]
MSQSSPPAPESAETQAPTKGFEPRPPGRLKHWFIRYGLRFFVSCYLRVRVTGLHNVPTDRPYMLCFSHPSWVDPMLLAAFWPDTPRVFIFGPKEEDMHAGRRNKIIRWTHMAVPFTPSKTNLLDTTRRAVAVMKGGYVLALAGEGRLSDRDGEIVPLEDGASYFALRARVPILPMTIIGSRWLRFGKRIEMRAGPLIELGDYRADRTGMLELTRITQDAMERLLVGVVDEGPPGPFGRWMTDLLAERPWLTEQAAGDAAATDDVEPG